PGRHVAKSSEPHEAVGIVEVAELADHDHADSLLRLDEFAVEQVDQRLTPARMKAVAPKLHDGALAPGRGRLAAACGLRGVHVLPRRVQLSKPLAVKISSPR